EPRIRNWVTETQWLPRGDAYLIGQSFFDRLTYNAQLTAAYANLRLTSDPQQALFTPRPPPPFFPPYPRATDVNTSTGRISLWQELDAPFDLGPFKVVPYGKLLLAGYTNDINGDSVARVWGAGGVRSSLPLTRLYPNVSSELFNVQGLNHKIVVSGNYMIAGTNEPFTRFAM